VAVRIRGTRDGAERLVGVAGLLQPAAGCAGGVAEGVQADGLRIGLGTPCLADTVGETVERDRPLLAVPEVAPVGDQVAAGTRGAAGVGGALQTRAAFPSAAQGRAPGVRTGTYPGTVPGAAQGRQPALEIAVELVSPGDGDDTLGDAADGLGVAEGDVGPEERPAAMLVAIATTRSR
jgi:hypothetical protein